MAEPAAHLPGKNPVNPSYWEYFGRPGPNKFQCGWVKENNPRTPLWVLPKSLRERHDDTFKSESPPTTDAEAIERTGGIFYDHC